eukprot:2015456-Alexandrium_andersonii.AAC.1
MGTECGRANADPSHTKQPPTKAHAKTRSVCVCRSTHVRADPVRDMGAKSTSRTPEHEHRTQHNTQDTCFTTRVIFNSPGDFVVQNVVVGPRAKK